MESAPQTRHHAYVITLNNPQGLLQDYLEEAKSHGCKSAIMQLEEGQAGTRHIQGFLWYTNARTFSSVKNKFPQAHIEVSVDPFAAWQYCGKVDTRVEGPLSFGPVPKPRKVKGANYKEFNAAVLEDLEGLVESGEVSIRDYLKLH